MKKNQEVNVIKINHESGYKRDIEHLEWFKLGDNTSHTLNEHSKKRVVGYNPTVTISNSHKLLSDGQKQIAIIIKDNGPGIPDSIKDKFFQPFFTTKDTGKGTGLGLSLANDIVKAHGGGISVESVKGAGSEFIIQLPIK